MHVAICCVTYRRPDGLRRLLSGLNALTFEKRATPKITLIVVDNDRSEPMRALVDALRPQFRWEVHYDVERVPGVASARNRSLALVPADADYVAMIDDDEVPVPSWLDELLDVSQRFGADMIQGPVQPCFESPPPAWLTRGRFLELGPYRDGAPLIFGYSGNVLMNARAIRDAKLQFDEAFNLTGGEDQRFFGLALERGLRIVASERAIIRESVPAERATLSYLIKRRFRMGNTLARIDRIEGDARRLAIRFVKGLGRMGLGLAQTAALVFRGTAGAVAGLCNVAWGVGTLAGLAGVAYQEYGGASGGAARPPIPHRNGSLE